MMTQVPILTADGAPSQMFQSHFKVNLVPIVTTYGYHGQWIFKQVATSSLWIHHDAITNCRKLKITSLGRPPMAHSIKFHQSLSSSVVSEVSDITSPF
jgi:hypothetical protein